MTDAKMTPGILRNPLEITLIILIQHDDRNIVFPPAVLAAATGAPHVAWGPGTQRYGPQIWQPTGGSIQ